MTAREWLTRFPAGSPGPTEADAKELLRSYSIATPRSATLAPGGDRALVEPPPFDGPYAVKVASPRILHKTELGALRLGVSRDDLAATLTELGATFPGDPLLIEEMVGDISVELIAGAFVDPNLGPTLMIGAGGVLAELYRDVSFRLVPCTEADVSRMLDELSLAPLLDGYRSIPADREALVGVLVTFSRLIEALGESIAEFDVNPLCYANGRWVALDAKIVLSARG